MARGDDPKRCPGAAHPPRCQGLNTARRNFARPRSPIWRARWFVARAESSRRWPAPRHRCR